MSTAVLLSGGVDSSVALLRAVEQSSAAERPTAFYLKIWLEDELRHLGQCPWEEDLAFARATCEALGVGLEVVPLQREYHERVVTYAVDELRAGRTPSPDIFCNRRIKFGAFLDAVDASFDTVVTGHYARRVVCRDGRARLVRAVDPVKDQTYFLSRMTAPQVERCRFPLGEVDKSRVREIARDHDLPARARKDSQGICFLGKLRFDDFVRSYLGERPGEIRHRESGRVLGEHRGYWFHTIGQRRGLRLSQGPWFVVGKDVERDIVWVSHKDELATHAQREFEVDEPEWIHGAPAPDRRLRAKLRHGPRLTGCRLSSPAPETGARRVTLDAADPGIAPGQFAVFYDGDVCLGAGRIRSGR